VCTTQAMMVTSYSTRNRAGADWAYYRPKKKGARTGTVGPGTVAVANTNPQPYSFGCPVTVTDPHNNIEYTGTVHDTGAGWDAKHHDMKPDKWIDIWKPSRRKALEYGVQFRMVTICCDDCSK
jgi:hypothetical protein